MGPPILFDIGLLDIVVKTGKNLAINKFHLEPPSELLALKGSNIRKRLDDTSHIPNTHFCCSYGCLGL